jgi:hypothetical protein
MTGRRPLGPRRGEALRESNSGKLSRPEDLTGILLNMQNDPAVQSCGGKAHSRFISP